MLNINIYCTLAQQLIMSVHAEYYNTWMDFYLGIY